MVGYMKALDTKALAESGVNLQNAPDEEKGEREKGGPVRDKLKQTGLVAKIGTRGRVKVEASACLCLRTIISYHKSALI